MTYARGWETCLRIEEGACFTPDCSLKSFIFGSNVNWVILMVWPPVLQPLCMCWSREGGNSLALAAFGGAARSGLRAAPARVAPVPGERPCPAGCPWAPLCCTAFQGYWAREGEHRCANPHLFPSKTQRLIAFTARLYSGQLHVL